MKHKHDKTTMHDYDASHQPPSRHGECCCTETGEPIPAASVSGERIGKSAEIWHIPGMDCPIEEKEIRQALSGIEGIHSLFFRLSSRSLEIDATDEARENALKAIGEAGFGVTFVRAERADHDRPSVSRYWKEGVALVIALAVEFLHVFAPQTLLFEILVFSLAISAILLAGLPVYISGLRALFHGRLNISALMAVAVTGACILEQWAEAATVMVLYAIAELIEARSIDRARNAIRTLLNLAPETAECRLPDGRWETVHVRRVMPGQVIRTKPGERIPLDGRIVSGYSVVNQMPITGESLLIEKMPEDIVYAGSINESGLLEIKVTSLASDTLLARIIARVEEAQEARAPTQRFIDRFAAVYVPAIFLVALAVAVLMPLAAGWTWHDAVYRALVLLVIACPCALVIATPITVVSGLTAAARVGILIKGGVYLEKAHKLKVVALDKTGTVTEGRPRLVGVEYLKKAASPDRILCWAATLAFRSAHPVSRAIYEGISEDARPGDAENFIEIPGKGSQAVIEEKKRMLGNVRWIREQGLDAPGLQEQLARYEKSGYTVTLLASEEEVLALFAVADRVRSNSVEAVEELICRKITPVMLTGDNALTAEIIASQVGIRDVRSNLLPEDKLAAIEALQAKYRHVAMVGDGINDAPALALADVGIAMGGAGTDMAMETADVVIMNDDPRRVIDLVRLSRRTFRLLRQNIVIALGIKLLFLILALAGYASMWMAVFADVGATLIVVFNGLRLLRWRSRFVRH